MNAPRHSYPKAMAAAQRNLAHADQLARQGKHAQAAWLTRQTMQVAVAMTATQGLYQSTQRRSAAGGCSACSGNCPTPAACELPVASATKPPRAAFWMAAAGAWLRRPVLRTRLALARWHLDCLRDEREFYKAAGCIGPVYLRNSLEMDVRLMARIRELEARL